MLTSITVTKDKKESTDTNYHKYNTIKDFKAEQRHYLLTSRFNNETWNENHQYRLKHRTIGCIYCAPDKISQSIPLDAIVFILEMNNDTNKIIGLGMVRNRSICDKFHVYEHGNYNRFVYVGNHRISREEMDEEEETIMKVFDILCFKGNKHMKRGHGLKTFPMDMLYRCSKIMDLVDFVNGMFKKRITKKE